MGKIIALKELGRERKGTKFKQIIIIQATICINTSTRFHGITEENN